MVAVANNRIDDNLMLLPDRESPYLLREVFELVRDDCRSDLVLQWSEGYLSFRADADTDSLCFDFHSGEFELSRHHDSVSSAESLATRETDVLRALVQGPRTKQELGARAKLVGAYSQPGNGKQGGGLLGRRLIHGEQLGCEIQYTLTAAGRSALAATLWKTLLGKECSWTWVARNQQGYCDSVMLSFDGVVPTVLLHVIASSIEVLSITRS
jgi:hypothetical protein